MANKRILFVGSGPSVYGGLLAIKDFKNLNVTIIDNSNIEREDQNECIFNNKFKFGNRINNENSSEKENLKLFDETANISKSFGGFSNVWGGTLDSPTIKTQEEFKKVGIDLKKSIEYVEKNIPQYIGDENFEYFVKRLKVNDLDTKKSKIAVSQNRFKEINSKDVCKECGSYKWSCKNNSIWSSKKEILKFIELYNFKYIPNAKLLKFHEKDETVKCTVAFDDSIKEYDYEKLFVGSGPIGTSIIYINSNTVSKVKFKSSDLIQVPYIKFRKSQTKKTSFADIFAYDKNDNFYIQFYFFSKSVLKLAGNIIKFTNIDKFLPSKLLNYFGGVFIYLDQDLSSNFELYKKNGELCIKKFDPPEKQITVKKNIIKKLKKSGFYPISFLSKNLKFGKSYHYGGQFPHSVKAIDNFTDEYGRLKNLENSHIIDASVLPVINTGPVTNTIIANSYRITGEVIRQFESR